MILDPGQLRRWSRQVRLPQLGPEGQEKLAAATVAIVGVGGLGCPAALYLAAAGVGTLGLIDDDAVDATNLQRQVLFTERDIGRGKVEVAAQRLAAMHERLTINQHATRLTAANARELLAQYEIVVDGNDNFPTRYAVNDACVLSGKPNVYGSVLQFEGRASLFVPGHGPCYRCLYAEPPPPGLVPNCADAGVLGVLPGVIGSIQAAEAIKWICGIGETLVGRLLVIDMLAMSFDEFEVARNPQCALCGDTPTITEPVAYTEFCDTSANAGEYPDDDYDRDDRITPRVAKRRIDAGDPIVLLDVREPIELQMAAVQPSQWLPLGEFEQRWQREILPHRHDEVIVLCHHGVRSRMVVDFLREQGFARAKNLDGGIDRWSTDADRSIPRY
jgi:adenylyltransferase/sulfurtransferase